MAGPNKKCPECGKNMGLVDGRWACALCGREVMNKNQKHLFLESNREAILEDLNKLGRGKTREKWRIANPTISGLLKRWGVKPAAAPPTPPAAAADNHLPSLPAWKDDWPESVQLKWLEILGGRLK